MFRSTLSALLAAAALGLGCASVVYDHSQLVAPERGAEVTVFRDPTWATVVFRARVDLDGEALMKLRRASYGRVFVAPGRHEIDVWCGGSHVGGPVEFVAGRSYDLLVTPPVALGFWSKPPSLRDLDARDADRLAGELSPVGEAAAARRRFPWDRRQACGRGILAAQQAERGR